MNKLDVKGFNHVFKSWYEMLCLYAYKYVKDGQIAEDMVQEVFVNLWTSRDTISIEKNVRNYLFRATRNACLAYFRKLELDQRTTETFIQQNIPEEETETELNDLYRKLRLHKAIENLPAKTREVFDLHKKDGLSFVEIAGYLGKSPKTIEKQVARAYRLLKKELHPES